MEILNRTKQQYISQNYVILCTTIAWYAICLGEGLWPMVVLSLFYAILSYCQKILFDLFLFVNILSWLKIKRKVFLEYWMNKIYS